jgi:uncharacterized repeat protein (TIGR01451 family)
MKRLPAAVAIGALLLTLALAVPAGAAVFIQVLGHKDTYFNHFGDPAKGRVRAYAEGQEFDTGLRGKSAMIEVRKVRRVAIYDVELQVLHNGVFVPVAHNPSDVNSSGVQPAVVRQWTPLVPWCATSTLARTYRVRSLDGIRWDDGTFSSRTHYSRWFGDRILASDPVCPPPPPPPVEADVRVTKTASVASVPGTADTAFSYTLRVENLDTTDAASSVVVTDTLPGEVDLVGALPANCTDTDPGAAVALRCTFGTLDPGEVNSVTINVTADASDFTDGTIANTARVASSTADPNPANNTSSVDVLVRPLADVTVDKEADQASVTVPGDTFRYVLRVTNTGPSAAANVTVVDTLPEGLEVVALPVGCVNDADPTAEPDTITCTFGTLAAGASASVSIDVVTDATRADDTLPYVNTARVTTSTYEQNTGNNSDTETTPVVPA